MQATKVTHSLHCKLTQSYMPNGMSKDEEQSRGVLPPPPAAASANIGLAHSMAVANRELVDVSVTTFKGQISDLTEPKDRRV